MTIRPPGAVARIKFRQNALDHLAGDGNIKRLERPALEQVFDRSGLVCQPRFRDGRVLDVSMRRGRVDALLIYVDAEDADVKTTIMIGVGIGIGIGVDVSASVPEVHGRERLGQDAATTPNVKNTQLCEWTRFSDVVVDHPLDELAPRLVQCVEPGKREARVRE